MRVFVAGATGAIGKPLVSRLVAAGHEVHGMTRSESKRAMLDALGAVPVVADALDPDQVAEAVGRAKPDVIVHQLTALAGEGMRNLKHRIAMTNRLRIEGTSRRTRPGCPKDCDSTTCDTAAPRSSSPRGGTQSRSRTGSGTRRSARRSTATRTYSRVTTRNYSTNWMLSTTKGRHDDQGRRRDSRSRSQGAGMDGHPVTFDDGERGLLIPRRSAHPSASTNRDSFRPLLRSSTNSRRGNEFCRAL